MDALSLDDLDGRLSLSVEVEYEDDRTYLIVEIALDGRSIARDSTSLPPANRD